MLIRRKITLLIKIATENVMYPEQLEGFISLLSYSEVSSSGKACHPEWLKPNQPFQQYFKTKLDTCDSGRNKCDTFNCMVVSYLIIKIVKEFYIHCIYALIVIFPLSMLNKWLLENASNYQGSRKYWSLLGCLHCAIWTMPYLSKMSTYQINLIVISRCLFTI